MIKCTTLHGDTKLVPAKSLVIRPATYAVITHENDILLVNTKSTGRWFFPGGEIEKGEMIHEALLREVREETGITVTIDKLLTVHESFFYYDPWDTAFQNISFIYRCTPEEFEVSDSKNEKRDEAEKPQWIPIPTLSPDDFQDFAKIIFSEFITQ